MDISRWSRSRAFAVAATLGLTAALAAACAAEDPDADTDPPAAVDSPAGEDAAGTEPTIEIVEPADGATVTVPFDVSVDAGVELGPIDEGLNHFHVWFGDAQDQPLIVESDSGTVEDAPNGEQTMWVSLQEADHTPVGNPVSISVTVEGGTGGGQPPPGPGDY